MVSPPSTLVFSHLPRCYRSRRSISRSIWSWSEDTPKVILSNAKLIPDSHHQHGSCKDANSVVLITTFRSFKTCTQTQTHLEEQPKEWRTRSSKNSGRTKDQGIPTADTKAVGEGMIYIAILASRYSNIHFQDNLAANVRVETERRLHALEKDLAQAQRVQKERTMATRYHKVKFFGSFLYPPRSSTLLIRSV